MCEMMMMQMSFYQACNCTFLFKQLESKKDQCSLYSVYLGLTFLFCLLVDSIPTIKTKIILMNQEPILGRRKLLLIVLQFVWYVGSAMTMLLLMTFNWLVVIVVCLSKLFWYVYYGMSNETKACQFMGGNSAVYESCHK